MNFIFQNLYLLMMRVLSVNQVLIIRIIIMRVSTVCFVGCLMLIGWMMCASTALILSKYYKRMWPNRKLCGAPVWLAVSVLHYIKRLLRLSSLAKTISKM